MLEEERNKYFEQARQATLAEIAGNQQAMLDNAAAEQVETIEPAYIIADRPQTGNPQGAAGTDEKQLQAPAPQAAPFTSPIDPNLVANAAMQNQGAYVGGGMTMPAGVAEAANAAAPQAQPAQMASPINPNMVAEAAQQYPGTYVGHGMYMPADLVNKANQVSLTPFDDVVNEAAAQKEADEKQKLLEQMLDPRVQRAENSRKWIAGIGDALASVANLVGTGNFASNQKQTYSLPGVNEAIEQDRARRQASYQKALDRYNALEIQAAKDKQAELERAAKKEKGEADRALKKEQDERDFNYKQSKDERDFKYKEGQDAIRNDLNTRKQEADEKYKQQQIALGYYRANKGGKDTPDGGGDDRGRFSGKRSGGIKEAKVDYNAMLDEIAENNGCEDWADLSNRRKNDPKLRAIFNQFDFEKFKGSPSQIEHKISTYARDWAPEFHAYYFGSKGNGGEVDFGGYKAPGAGATAAPSGGGTLSSIMSSTPQADGKKRRRKQ